MRRSIRSALREAAKKNAPALVYAAGHDHSLQVFRPGPEEAYMLVSGLGSKSRASAVGAAASTLFAHSNTEHAGFMQLDFLSNGQVRLAVIETDAQAPDGGKEVFSMGMKEPGSSRIGRRMGGADQRGS
jgi:hypothetical protein